MARKRVFSLFDLAARDDDERDASFETVGVRARRRRGLNLKGPALFAVTIYEDRQGRLCVALHPTEKIVRHAAPFGYVVLFPDDRILPLTEEDYGHLLDWDLMTWKDPGSCDGGGSCSHGTV